MSGELLEIRAWSLGAAGPGDIDLGVINIHDIGSHGIGGIGGR